MNWEIKKLGEVCEFYNGKAHEKSIDENGKYKVVNSKFVSSNGTKAKRTQTAQFPLFKDDIVMVMSDVPNGKTLAKCFLIDKDDTYSLNQRVCAFRTTNFDKQFLFYQLNRNEYFLNYNNGENQSNLRKGDILDCPLFVPSIKEQKQIVTILDKAFTAIDKAKTNAQQNLINAKELFESYLQNVFKNKGDDWDELTLKEIAQEFSRGKSKHRPRGDKSILGGKYPLVQTGDISNSDHWLNTYSNTYNEKGLAQSKLWQKGTICIAIVGSNVAETAILTFDSCFPDSVIGIDVNPKKANNEYVEYLLQSFKSYLKEKGKGTARDNINLGTFQNQNFPFPSVKEQQEIVKKLNSLSSETKKLEGIYSRKIDDLEELKKSILQKAFKGELLGK